jgi:hypothetical protein
MSDRRGQGRWSVEEASALFPGVERTGVAAVRFHRFVRHRVNAHKSNSTASDENEPNNRQKHKDNANDSENHQAAETETAWWRLGKPKLRQLHASSAENTSHEIWNNPSHDQTKD